MNIKEFQEWADKRNDKWVRQLWTYFEDFIFVEHNPWKHKITFLDKFVKVFWDYWAWTCDVDENIGLINDQETMYISEEYLDFCINNKIIGEDAYDMYHVNLDNNMWETRESYEETLAKLPK